MPKTIFINLCEKPEKPKTSIVIDVREPDEIYKSKFVNDVGTAIIIDGEEMELYRYDYYIATNKKTNLPANRPI
jgi:hypothetical protein